MVKIGPSGGLGGHPYENYLIPDGARLREIHIFADEFVNAIQFVYQGADDSLVIMPRIGGRDGQQNIFRLEDEEFLLGIQGQCGWFIDTLSLHTNQRSSPQYGGQGGEKDYFLNAPAGSEIVGLFGRADWHVDALGIVTRERATSAREKSAARGEKPAVGARGSGRELLKVEGIGPKIAELLSKNGIGDLAALAGADPFHLREILTAAGRGYHMADPTTWPEQAAMGAAGDWDRLAAYQDRLKGGRPA